MKQEEIEPYWTKIAEDVLVGKKIVSVRYMTEGEMENLGWYSRCVVIELSDGNLIFPSQDDEGNDAGSLFTNDPKHQVLPVI